MTMTHMRKLHLDLALEGPLPLTFAKMVGQLVRHVLGNPSDEEVAQCLLARSSDLTPPRSVLLEAENLEQVSEYFEQDELKSAKDARAKHATKKGSGAKPAPSSTIVASSSSASTAVPAQKQKPRPEWESCEGAPANVSEWLPTVSGAYIYKETKFHLRWKGGYPTDEPPYNHSKTFPTGSPELAYASFMAVLRWIWCRHEAKTGERCPFRLDP